MGRFLSLFVTKPTHLLYCKVRSFSVAASKKQEVQSGKKWESVIGLEIHAQIASNGKLFSGAGTKFAVPVNTQVAFFDAALPGTLPVLNKQCVEAGVITALALNSNLNMVSKFDRKHYFYADLPTGYQITQQRLPLAIGGWLHYPLVTSEKGGVPKILTARLTQIQLEQDSGKSLHDTELNHSLIDLNRAGIGLMEIVTDPDFRSAAEAAAFVREFQLLLQTIGTCNANMSEGNMRVDASVSIRHPGHPLGTRAEVKNLNSVRFVGKAIEYEIRRQTELLENGNEVVNETRSFDIDSGETVAMRDKERLHDYRFLPEPNLPPLRLYMDQTFPLKGDPSQFININTLERCMPELPDARRSRMQEQYKLSLEQAIILVNESDIADYYETMMEVEERNPKIAINLLLNNLLALLNNEDTLITDSPVSAAQLGDVVDLLQKGTISKNTAKWVIQQLYEKNGKSATDLVEKEGLSQITDLETLSAACAKVLEEHPQVVADFKNGKKKVWKFLLGQTHKQTGGRAEPRLLSEILEEKIKQM